jgi:hypothetical protein
VEALAVTETPDNETVTVEAFIQAALAQGVPSTDLAMALFEAIGDGEDG